ncbi:hypothetical protein CAAN1_28S00254 [[Candida] anglica]|uniref:Anaphase-promoting complex subunit 5 n=1 Tax=[Candida] anglica TaxID=148631 RepID=A0ABP0EQF0_9ASCO
MANVQLLLSEDLSPHKLALLFLVGLYCSGVIDFEEIRKVLGTVIKLLDNEPLRNKDGHLVVVPQLHDLLDLIDSPKTSAKLESVLWKVNSVESLESSVTAMQAFLCQPNLVTAKQSPQEMTCVHQLLPSSFLGLFVQKIVTTCSLLHFDESCLLYNSFVEYRGDKGIHIESEPSKEDVASSDLELFSILSDQLTLVQEPPSKILPVPKLDMEILLEHQISLLETSGTPMPDLLREIMTLMTSPASNTCLIQNADFNNLPSYSYLRYLEALRSSDYHTAFQALHQYFDYMVSNNSKYFYHFALISRASLHQHFGEDEKALNAIEEAISVARENKDNATLTYILSWLFNFMRNKPDLWYTQTLYHNNNESHLLDFLVTKSQTVSLPLYAMSYHFDTLHVMNNGEPLSRVLQSLLRGMYISIHDHLPSSFIKSSELGATVWSRAGNTHLAMVYSAISQGIESKLADEVAVRTRKALFLYQQGEVDNAYQLLEQLRKQTMFDRALFQPVQIRGLILLTKINLYRGRHVLAERIMQILSNTEIPEIELKLELVYLNAEVQMTLQNYSEALLYLNENLIHLERTKTQMNLHMVTRLNFLKARIFIESGAPSRAFSLTIHQLQKSKQLGMMSLVAEGAILLASILNRMESYKDAYDVLGATMATIHMVQNQEFTAMAYYEYAYTCLMTLEQDSKAGGREVGRRLLNLFLRFLNNSIDGFRKSLNLVMLQKSFQLELKMAKLKSLVELEEHAEVSLEKLRIRLREEVNYGFVHA